MLQVSRYLRTVCNSTLLSQTPLPPKHNMVAKMLMLPATIFYIQSIDHQLSVGVVLEDALLLQVEQALLRPLQALQVLHQLPQVVSGLPGLGVGEPAAAKRHQDGQTQHQVLPAALLACRHTDITHHVCTCAQKHAHVHTLLHTHLAAARTARCREL